MVSVLHICTDFSPSTGGIERFVLDLAGRSAAIGIRTEVLCLDRIGSQPEKLPREAVVGGIPVTRVPFVNLKFYKPAVLPLSLLQRHDILHVHGVGALLDFAVLTRPLHGKRIVVSTHGGLFHRRAMLAMKRLYFFGLQRLALRFVDAVVACSKSDYELFARISSRVVLIENAIDTGMYLALSRDAQQDGRCMYVGRLAENKGIAELLQAFAASRRQGAAFQLRLIGRDIDGNQQRYAELARQLGIADRVVFVGEVSQEALLEEYRRAQLFVSASRYEGFGLSAIEAKAAGCRLVLHENEAFTHLFSGDAAATLLDFTDAAAAGAALGSLLSAGGTRSTPGRDAVEAYSWQRKLSEWQLLYRTCIRA